VKAPRFLTPLVVVHVSDRLKRLAHPLEFESVALGRTITVPAGFETDFASVPRLPLAYWLFGGVADEAAVIHDYAYSGALRVTRKQADELFSEAMKACGTAAWRRGPMWLGVRLFGGIHYNEPVESMAP
jgi:hypothetical protein